jgi:DNA-binding transcriptional ArsR family regulator
MVPAERLLPDVGKPALSKIVKALLEAEEAVSKSELAERAGVSKQSVSNHREELEAFGLLEVTETTAGVADAYRLRVPWKGELEQLTPRFFVEGEHSNLAHAVEEATTELGVGPLAVEHPNIWERLDPWETSGELGEIDLAPLGRRLEWLRPWVDMLSALVGSEIGSRRSGGANEWAANPYDAEHRFGVSAAGGQSSLAEATETAGFAD